MQLIKNNGPKVCAPYEREYLITSETEKQKFAEFMKRHRYKATGEFVSDAGKTIIFY